MLTVRCFKVMLSNKDALVNSFVHIWYFTQINVCLIRGASNDMFCDAVNVRKRIRDDKPIVTHLVTTHFADHNECVHRPTFIVIQNIQHRYVSERMHVCNYKPKRHNVM